MTHDPGVATFITEARDLLVEMESALLACEIGAADVETINSIFRAAHTIKGSAGLFGLDIIVSFTHVVESALDRVRAGEIALGSDLTGVLIDCKDHLESLISAIREGVLQNDPALDARGESLLMRLHQITSGDVPSEPVLQIAETGASDCWHISIRFGRDVLRNGMDPLSFLRYLTTFGEIVNIHTIDSELPPPDEMDAESCYLGFEMRYRSDADKARIEGAFEFVRDDCSLRILPPRARLSEYVQLIRELPEADDRIGEILVKCGTLTAHELKCGLRIQAQLATEPSPPTIGEILIAQRAVQPAVVEAAATKQQQGRAAKSGETNSIRVDADKLEHLIDLVGELIIAGASANLIARSAGLADLNEATSRMSRLVEGIRDQALQLRMVQIGGTFARFQRVVRDVARELNKDIRLELSGTETELDKTVIEQINDPLMHLVRNAMDHGIEDARTREGCGKPAQGIVRLNAFHDSGSVVIEVSDDGGGLDRERILAKARERRLVDEAAVLSDKEIFGLIFEPGFSTAATITNLSGRGVGMDVVKRNVTDLRGEVEVDSIKGVGTTVRIRLPLTLAIIDGFLVRVGRSSYVLPLEMVDECIEAPNYASQAATEHQFIDLRGAALPYIRLRDVFRVACEPARRESVVVVRVGKQRAGFVVDELLGEHQTVIKPLAPMLSRAPGLSGSTILADGSIALIVDTPALLRKCIEVLEARTAA